MLTVKTLIDQLEKLPMDAPVFVYSDRDEGDCEASEAVLCHELCGDYQMEAYYCQGDSNAAIFLGKNPDCEGVVVIGTFCE